MADRASEDRPLMNRPLRPTRGLLALAVAATTLVGAAGPVAAAPAAGGGPATTRIVVERRAAPTIRVLRSDAADGRVTSVGTDVVPRALDGRARPAGVTPSTFIVSYSGFSTQARKAFQSAVDYWEATVVSPVPIRIKASFANLPGNVLGSAGAAQLVRSFPGSQSNTWYPVALANRIAGTDLAPSDPDILAQFDNAQPWFFGVDNVVPAGKISFRTVVLHELGHGLGFFGSMRRGGDGKGRWGAGPGDNRPFIFDRFAEKADGTSLLSLGNGTTALGNALVSKNLWAEGGGLERSKLFAPATFQPGSSYSHWDETRYGRGNIDSLMTPTVGFGEGIATAGPRTLAFFKVMGWGNAAPTACKKPHDLTGDGLNDLMGVTGNVLMVLPGNGAGRVTGPLAFGGDWTNANLLALSPDLNGDGCADFVVRIGSQLRLFLSDGDDAFIGSNLLGNDSTHTALLAPGDLTGDGDADLALVRADGDLVRLDGDGEGGFEAPTVMATGFGAYTEIMAPGDFDGDGDVDLLVRGAANNGTLRLFRGDGSGGLISPSLVIGTGWNDFDELLAARDMTGDRNSDVYGRAAADGDLVLLRGDGDGSVMGPFLVVGQGFDVFDLLD